MRGRADSSNGEDTVHADNASYRKGLVLGLTLAELGILVIFVLLLALGGILSKKDRQISELRAELPKEKAAHRLLSVLAERTNDTPQQVRTMARELVAAAARDDENKVLLRRERETRERLEAVEASVEQAAPDHPRDETDRARSERIRKSISRIVEERAAARAALDDLRGGDKTRIADTIAVTRLENERLKGTVAYANRRLQALGKGTERPACWATPQGAPEYIFDVTLLSSGIVTHDRQLPNRAAQQARLPLSTISFDHVVQGLAFQTQTRPLFEWGETHDCRFFVRIIDRTGTSEKARYKNLKLFVEGHF